MNRPSEADRVAPQARPSTPPIMHQTWDDLLFLHWKVDPGLLRTEIPNELSIDIYEDAAWIGVTPFSIRNARLSFSPSLPFVSSSLELNVRTYVHAGNVPGVWFFSLDASNPLAVYLARLGFSLPYYRADMSIDRRPTGEIFFESQRIDHDGLPADLSARWRPVGETRQAQPDTLEFFLIERYWLYSMRRGRLSRARIHHNPWSYRDAELLSWRETVVDADGLARSDTEPLTHAQVRSVDVDVWPLQEV